MYLTFKVESNIHCLICSDGSYLHLSLYNEKGRKEDEEKVTLQATIYQYIKEMQCLVSNREWYDIVITPWPFHILLYNINMEQRKVNSMSRFFHFLAVLTHNPYQSTTALNCLAMSCSVCCRENPHTIRITTLLAEERRL